MRFNDIEINYDEIPQSELNIDIRTRTNLFAWNGQFSPQFVEAELTKYAKDGYFVLDPYLGSGTVLYECARKDISAYGVELNVSAYSMAKMYELSCLNMEERNRLVYKVEKMIQNVSYDENYLDRIVNEALNNANRRIKEILTALIIIMDICNKKITTRLLLSKWNSLKDIILELPETQRRISAENGDARNIPLEDNCVDMILTSPPYINVFNYHQKYRASVEKLGYDVLDIAKSEIGANRKNRSNRLYTVIQYCIDIALSLKEAERVCKKDARMIYVVGRESTVLGYTFCNSELVYNLGTQIFGFAFDIRQERVFKNRYGQMIYEDIIHFVNNKLDISEEDVIEKARIIAVEMLKSKRGQENKNCGLLEEAIRKADKINKSEVRYAQRSTW